MRSIRQYVIAAHRLSDNPDLAYTLFVAAIESLAHSSATESPAWTDYDQAKRTNIDKALVGADDDLARRVREAVLQNEHVAVRRRFKEFTLSHIKPSFFREESNGISSPVPRSMLARAVDKAYAIRSDYIHNLREIPRVLSTAVGHDFEAMYDDLDPALTFNGLSRVARHVIFTFLDRQELGDDPDFDYRRALPNIVQMRMASRYWIANPAGFSHKSARRHFGAHMEELGAHLRQPITDLRPLLERIEELLPTLAKRDQRVAMAAIYFSWHLRMSSEHHRPNSAEIMKKYDADLDEPSTESLILHVSIGNKPPWSLEECKGLYRKYFDKKFSRTGYEIGPYYETALTLWLAEVVRASGDLEKARELIAFAVENNPKNGSLTKFEMALPKTGDPGPIDWSKILSPEPEKNAKAEVTQNKT